MIDTANKKASVFAAAKYLAQYSNWSLSNLKIQKLLYIANMVYLAKNKNPLLDRQFEAWMYGPVIPILYHKLKIFGSDPVENIFRQYQDLENSNHKNIISEVYDELGTQEAATLVAITHRTGSGWDKHYDKGTFGCIITEQSILAEYQKLLDDGIFCED